MLKPKSRNARPPRPQREVAEREQADHRARSSPTICAVAHVDDAPRGAREILVVRDDDDRRPIGVQPLEQRDHLRAGVRVELARRLVGEQERRAVRQRARDRDALLLAAGQLRRPMALASPSPT